MALSHAKIRLKTAPQKLNFVTAKATSESYTLDCSCKCPCTFPHNYALITQLRIKEKTLYMKLTTFSLAKTIEN